MKSFLGLKKHSADRYTFILGATYLSYNALLNMILTEVIGQNSLDSVISLLMLVVPFAIWSLTRSLRIPFDILLFPIAVLMMLRLDELSSHFIQSTYDRIFQNLIEQGLFGYVFARALSDDEKIYETLPIIAHITFISAVAIPFMPNSMVAMFNGENSLEEFGAYMLLGFRMLPAAIIYLYLSLKSGKKAYKILAVISIIETVIFANRGAVVTIALFYTGYILFYANIKKKGKFVFILIILAFIFTFITSEQGSRFLVSTLEKLNINSRNVTLLFGGEAMKSSREHIYDLTIQRIKDNLAFGVGFSGSWGKTGYPHNIILEIMAQFGVFLGSSILLIFAFNVCKVLSNKINKSGELFWIFFCIGFIPLLFSSSYLSYWMFWFMIGTMVSLKKNVKQVND